MLALYFQDVRHFSPLVTGLAMAPQPGVAALASALGGRHTAKHGARPVMLVGLTTGTLGLASLLVAGASTPYWMLVLPLLAAGFGTAYTMPAATARAPRPARSTRAGSSAPHSGSRSSARSP